MNDDNIKSFEPRRPKRGEAVAEPFTHSAFAFQRIGRRYGVYREVGVARVPACPHCGEAYNGPVKVFLNRVPIGGFSGGLLIETNGKAPPQIPPDHSAEREVNEDELLPQG